MRAPQYSVQAVRDLVQIWDHHFHNASTRAADSLIRLVDTTIKEIIAKQPLAGRLRPELGAEVRSFPVAPYMIFYRVHQRRVEVLRVLHGHRNLRQPLLSLLIAV